MNYHLEYWRRTSRYAPVLIGIAVIGKGLSGSGENYIAFGFFLISAWAAIFFIRRSSRVQADEVPVFARRGIWSIFAVPIVVLNLGLVFVLLYALSATGNLRYGGSAIDILQALFLGSLNVAAVFQYGCLLVIISTRQFQALARVLIVLMATTPFGLLSKFIIKFLSDFEQSTMIGSVYSALFAMLWLSAGLLFMRSPELRRRSPFLGPFWIFSTIMNIALSADRSLFPASIRSTPWYDYLMLLVAVAVAAAEYVVLYIFFNSVRKDAGRDGSPN